MKKQVDQPSEEWKNKYLRALADYQNLDPGLDLTYKELLAVLEEQGVEKIEIVGRQFNPHEMECIEVIEGKNDEVVEEVLPGYRFRGKIIRVAQVKVGKE